MRHYLLNEIVTNQYGKRAYRSIIIAYNEIPYETYTSLLSSNNNFDKEISREVFEKNLTVVAIFGL